VAIRAQARISTLMLGALATYLSQRRIDEFKAEREKLAGERSELAAAEARLRNDRVQVYTSVLDPYIEVLHSLGQGAPSQEANARLGSVDHRKAAFQFKMVGSDEVVRAFNAFARYIVDARRTGVDPPGEILRRWAALIFAIRRNVGERIAGLAEKDMIVDWVADIETVYPDAGQQSLAAEGSLSVSRDSPPGTYARVAGRQISMAKLEELRVLAGRLRDGHASDEEVVQLIALIPEAPGAEIMYDPDTYLSEHGEQLPTARPREILDAIDRAAARQVQPGDQQIIQEAVNLLRNLCGRKIMAVHPKSGQSFEIRG
jgi:hypothetical protein